MLHYVLFLSLLAWLFAPTVGCGGGGIGPIHVPMRCVNNVYHTGAKLEGGTAIGYIDVQVDEDCEWDGFDDFPGIDGDPFGPGDDDDSLDPINPHFDWDYLVDTNGDWFTEECVWAHDYEESPQAWTRTNPGSVVWDAIATASYRVAVAETLDACLSPSTRYYYTLRCPGAAPKSYYSWVGGEPPYITALTDGECSIEVFTSAFRIGIDPAVPLESCCSHRTFSVWR